jgi:hypothetical protein
MENEKCNQRTCGCHARTPEQALAGALRMRGTMNGGDRVDDAKALIWLLREYGWSVEKF